MFKFQNNFLQLYSEYTQYTEPQLIFHIWTALSGISACLGRRNHLQFGIQELFGNTYIVLVGPPASRKSTAIEWMLKRLKHSTKIRFAPDDTAGQRQGLIKKFIDETLSDETTIEEIEKIVSMATSVDDIDVSKIEIHAHPKDRHVLYAVADEFDSLIGTNARELTTFLIKCFNGTDYDYSTSSQSKIIKEPLLSILAGTQPTTLSECMPTASVGSGFSSRIIFVYANKKRPNMYPPRPPDNYLAQEVENIFHHVFYKTEGEFNLTPEAVKLSKDMYTETLELDDPRFIYYCNRRQTHLLKVSMLLAAARISYIITADDMIEANGILKATEQFMPEALGEFGLSPLSKAKQKLLEFMQYNERPATISTLWGMLKNDVKSNLDFLTAVQDLERAGKIEKIKHPTKGVLYVLRNRLIDIEETLASLNYDEEVSNITKLQVRK